jgi:hypothetical protein
MTGAKAQRVEQADADPVTMFVGAISTLLSAGKAHVVSRSGATPYDADPTLYGWRPLLRTNGEPEETRGLYQPQGDKIGYLDGDRLFLLPDVAIGAVNRMLRDQDRELPASRSTLGRRLRECGWLDEIGEDSPAKPVKLAGETSRVWVMRASRLVVTDAAGLLW